MDLTNSSFVNDTMDSIGDSILASPKDIGEGERAKNLSKVGKDALDTGVGHATHTVKAELEMASEDVNQEVLGDNTEVKSLTDLNDNQFIENLKNSMVEKVDGASDNISTEVKSTVNDIELNTNNSNIALDPRTFVNGAEDKVSEEFGQLKSSTIDDAAGVDSFVQNGLSETVDDVKQSVNIPQTDSNTGEKGELLDTVKQAAMTAVSDVQAGVAVQDAAKKAVTEVVSNVSPVEVPQTDGNTGEKGELLDTVKQAGMTAVSDVQAGVAVKDAAKKAVTEVVSNVSPDISSNLSAGLASFTSGGGSPVPTKSSTTTTTTQKLEPRVTFSDTLDTTSKVTSPSSKTTPISVLVADTNKTTTNKTHGVPALRRQPSTESRDNPFIPDGELSKETDELLKRSTIIRDKFYVDQQEKATQGLAGIDSTDHVDTEKSPILESAIAPVSAQPALSQVKGFQPVTAEVKPRMRENGKLEDPVSPEGIKPEVEKGAAAASADGSKLSPEASGENDKDKKKQKKCCSIM